MPGSCHRPADETTVKTHPDLGSAAAAQLALQAAAFLTRPEIMQPMAHEGFWQALIWPVAQCPAARQRRWHSGSAVPPLATGAAVAVYVSAAASFVTVTVTVSPAADSP